MEGTARGFRPTYPIIAGGVLLLLVLFCSPLILGLLAVMSASGGIASSSTVVVQPRPVENGPISVPKALIPVYEAAGQEYNVTWTVLAAIHFVETDFSMGNSPTSVAGAEGPMQFEPSTFAAYGVTAPGNEGPRTFRTCTMQFIPRRIICRPMDSHRIHIGAIFQYNHAGWYVDKVMSVANEIGSMSDQLWRFCSWSEYI